MAILWDLTGIRGQCDKPFFFVAYKGESVWAQQDNQAYPSEAPFRGGGGGELEGPKNKKKASNII